ncbi:hypothetical protein Vretimale_6501 [Volvox reticuliferus]|uniref:Uncharacterized protein n=1 Tax=Volvox reticuliferus TaxID=1737510 RepID=A0A8J4FZJ5_9CHLO|nr:hypothetical protein Vretifemale_19991 [Volvox reticuliferus]GIM01687.1 hypothetical protein Vretimale_6501 [Volvox reticuliferus]
MHHAILFPPTHQHLRHNFAAQRPAVPLPSTPPSRRPCLSQPHPRRRPSTLPSAAAPDNSTQPPQPDPVKKRAEITANVERASAMVGEIVDEVTREMFISEAVAYIQEDRSDQTELTAVRDAVARRLDFLDANFLTTLSGFIRACEQRGDAQLTRVLIAIREEVLRQVAGRMPAAAQVLDLALRHADKDKRVGVLRAASAAGAGAGAVADGAVGASGGVPTADLDTLAATASKFIDEMEEQPEIPDRRLLARLVLLREEVRLLREEARFNAGADQPTEPVRSNVPQRCAAFLKELVAVSDPLRRVGLLAAAFERDWDGAAPKQKPQTAFHADQPDWVRPGRFMATLQSMVVQLQMVDEAASASTSGGSGGTAADSTGRNGAGGSSSAGGNSAVIARLEAIRSEAMAVLDRMHTAGGTGSSSGGRGGGDGGAPYSGSGDGARDGKGSSSGSASAG